MSKIKTVISWFKKNGLKHFFRTLKYVLLRVSLDYKVKKCQKILKAVNNEQKERIYNWIYFCSLKKKYQKFLNRLPKYESSQSEPNPKIIWWCWLQGEENAPDLCKSCLASIRKYYPDYQVNVVTDQNMWDYIEVPDYVKYKYENGFISRTHFSDILRTCLLVKYGGVWLDSTVLCTSRFENVLECPLFFYKNYKRGDESIVLSSWFISSQKDNPILHTVMDLLFDYWRTNDFLFHYFLFHFFVTMAADVYPDEFESIPRFSNMPPHLIQEELFCKYDEQRWQQYCSVSSFHKLRWNYNSKNTDIANTNYEYIVNLYRQQ